MPSPDRASGLIAGGHQPIKVLADVGVQGFGDPERQQAGRISIASDGLLEVDVGLAEVGLLGQLTGRQQGGFAERQPVLCRQGLVVGLGWLGTRARFPKLPGLEVALQGQLDVGQTGPQPFDGPSAGDFCA